MENNKIYFAMCNHWSESGIGFAFKKGYVGKKYFENCYSSIYTINKIIEELDLYPELIVGLELDIFAYEKINKFYPEVIESLREKLKTGRITIEGGTYSQPLGQDYSWESNILQLTYGKSVTKKILDFNVETFLVEEQWFHPQLPQLLKKAGFKFASLQWQNSGQVKKIQESMILWEGIDGSKIPTIPSNDNMVSCVTQHYNYEYLLKTIDLYHNPLIFQWVEVWCPGMDWGASISPHLLGIEKAKELNAEFVSLTNYFKLTADKKNLNTHYLKLADSNYGNDWYQGGGWGYNGDSVIRANNQTESLLMLYNQLPASSKNYETYWKKVLMLQNHDASVARSYRAFTEEDIETNADSFFVNQYANIRNEICMELDILQIAKVGKYYQFINGYSLANHYKIKKRHNECFKIVIDGKEINSYNTEDFLYFTVGNRNAIVEIVKCNEISRSNSKISCSGFEISHKGGFNVEIRKNGEVLAEISVFSGEIGKANEHDVQYYSLSPDPSNIAFAFDGNKFCYDQRAESMVRCYTRGNILILEAEILNLRNTDQFVSKVVSNIFIDEIANDIKVENMIYAGIPMNINSTFKVTVPQQVNPVVDYPFGEEQLEIDNFYVNKYVRFNNLIVVTDGSQRVTRNKNTYDFKLTKGRIFGKFNFNFALALVDNDFKKSIEYSNAFCYNNYLTTNNFSKYAIDKTASELVVTSNYYFEGENYTRYFNPSNVELNTSNLIGQKKFVDFYNIAEEGREIIQPFEIFTIKE